MEHLAAVWPEDPHPESDVRWARLHPEVQNGAARALKVERFNRGFEEPAWAARGNGVVLLPEAPLPRKSALASDDRLLVRQSDLASAGVEERDAGLIRSVLQRERRRGLAIPIDGFPFSNDRQESGHVEPRLAHSVHG